MNGKGKKRKNQENINGLLNNVLSNEEINRRISAIAGNLKASTWRDLETKGKFDKNKKLSFISDNMLIVGCDIGSEKHYLRAIDTRGRELSQKAFSFSNDIEGYEKAREWMLDLAARNDKDQIVLGLEPTGHYWFCLAAWLVEHGISVVQVNPYAVKQTKEIEDNSQLKSDAKDPKPIANLVKDGNYGMPYIPEGLYADIRRLSMFRDQLTENHGRELNRLHREMTIYFPEYKDAFGDLDGAFTLALLKEAALPQDFLEIGEDGIKEIWHKAKMRGCGYKRAAVILKFAEKSVGLKSGATSARMAIKWFAEQVSTLSAKLKEIENELHKKCLEIPYAENILEIEGIGENILAGILAEMGDISRFDHVKEIQKISGMGLVESSSGKHKGETRISHRGRKRLRYWLFLGAKSVVSHSEEFMALHVYYTTRENNPLKKMQSLIVIACKLLRIIFTLLTTGRKYDAEKMVRDIRFPSAAESQQTA